jgi:Putative zinc-finger
MTNQSQSHRQIWEMLPWALNGSASEAEAAAVHEHLRQCADCRDAWAFEQRLHDALSRPQPTASDADEGWLRLSARIDGASNAPLSARLRPSATTQVRWLAAAVIVEALALGIIVTSSWASRSERDVAGLYQTLSKAEVARTAPTIRAVLAPEMTLDEFRQLLGQAHLQVVAGPGEAGVWSLAPADDANVAVTESALRQLRGSAQVRFAEPIGAATGVRSP